MATATVTATPKPTAWWTTDKLGHGPEAEKGRSQFHTLDPNLALPTHIANYVNDGQDRTSFFGTVVGTTTAPNGEILLQFAFFDLDNNPDMPRFCTSSLTNAGGVRTDLKFVPAGLIYKIITTPSEFQKILSGGNPQIAVVGGATMTLDNPGDAKPIFPSSQ